DGTIGLRQPLISPLFGGVALSELWASFLGEGFAGKSARVLLREHWQSQKIDWDRTLQDGLDEETQTKVETPPVRPPPALPPARSGMELHFLPDSCIWDGRFGNVGWLQELPDPVTKLTWDNAVLVSVADARRLGLAIGDQVRVEAGGRSITAPVYV